MSAPREGFPTTRGSILLAVGSTDADVRRQAWEVLVTAYWKPVYKYLRVRWRTTPEDAEDLIQAFFARHIMLPGALVGLIVGYATQRYRGRGQEATPV